MMNSLLRGALVIGSLWSVMPVLAQDVRERKNIDDLTEQELAAYRHAVSKLQASTDPNNNYDYHAALHNLFLISPPHGCEHGNDLFLPWHRYHLHHFEQALRASDPDHPTLSTRDVTIPYWDWSKSPSGQRYPKAFEDKIIGGTIANPLYYDFRNTAPSGPAFDEDYISKIVRENPDWNDFAGGQVDVDEFFGALESPAHNHMHGTFISGSMGDPNEAAVDPIYWSFHAFIDRQWDRWQKVHNKPPTSLTRTLRGFTDAPTVADTVDVTALGYFYQHTPDSIAPPAPQPEAIALAPRSFHLVPANPALENLVATWGGSGPFVFQLLLPGAPFQRALLWLEEVNIPAGQSFELKVYIHPHDQSPQDEHAVGFFSIWRGHRMLDGQRHHTHGDMFLDISAQLAKLQQAQVQGQLAITLVPQLVPNRPRPGAQVAAEQAADYSEVSFAGLTLSLDGGRTQPRQENAHGH